MTIELAKAYVQIIPSAKGTKGKTEEEMFPPCEEGGKKGGQKFSAAFNKAVVAAGIGATIGKIFSDAFSAGSELQQNLGGTEAVFGQFATQIQAQADTAYKNMGMSASDYMATANKMASLFQGSGMSQQKSLDLTSQAMQRAADVASVMGIDTATAMESISGAAKGNFEMMDNLGVAMNATTLQAYALEKGINFNWNTATQAEKSELAMKMFMDRTSQYAGNFAKESEQTWSGSMEAMKGAYENLMGNLMLGNDLGPSLQSLAETVVTFVSGNLIPAVGSVLSALPGVIGSVLVNMVPALFQIVQDLLTQLGTAFTTQGPVFMNNLIIGIQTQLPQMLTTGGQAISNFINGIISSLPALITAAGTMIMQFITALAMMIPQLLMQGADILINIVNGFISNLPQIVAAVGSMIVNFAQAISQNLPRILQCGYELLGKLAAGLVRAIPNLIAQIPGIISAIINTFLNTDWGNVGINIIAGIATGLANAGSMLWDAVKDVLGSFKDQVLAFFGIHSPATWGIYVGEMVTLGIPIGVKKGETPLNKAAENIFNTVASPFEGYDSSSAATYNAPLNERASDSDSKLAVIIELLKVLIGSQEKEFKITIGDREMIRILREMGVAFE